MTVAIAIAGLLPIFSSTRTAVWVGYIARRPRRRRHASPLIHILVVTPVIFAWLREREFRKLAT